jgi:hypothetical protein
MYSELQSRAGILDRKPGKSTRYVAVSRSRILSSLLFPGATASKPIIINTKNEGTVTEYRYTVLSITETSARFVDGTGKYINLTVNQGIVTSDDDILPTIIAPKKLYFKAVLSAIELPLGRMLRDDSVSPRIAAMSLVAWLQSETSKHLRDGLSKESAAVLGRLCFEAICSRSAGDMMPTKNFLTTYMPINWDNVRDLEYKLQTQNPDTLNIDLNDVF